MNVVELVAARIRAAVAPVVVFEHAAPSRLSDGGTIPRHYLIVSGNTGRDESQSLVDVDELRAPKVTVRGISHHSSPQMAAAEVFAWSWQVRDTLRGWVPPLGVIAWRVEHESSSPPYTDATSLPDVAAIQTEIFRIQYQP